MGWEDPTYIEDFNTSVPGGPLPTDPKSEGDDHIRSIKDAINASFPNTTGPWNTSDPITIGTGVNPDHAARVDQLPVIPEQPSYGFCEGGTGTIAKLNGTSDWTVSYVSEGYYELVFSVAATDRDSQIVTFQIIANGTPSEGVYSQITAQYVSATVVRVWYALNGAEIDGGDWTFTRLRY